MIDTFNLDRAFCYRFGRYTVLPEILQLAQVRAGEDFRLKDMTELVLARHFSAEQLALRIKKKTTDRTEPVHSIIKFFVAYQADRSDDLVALGGGIYRAKTEPEITDDAVEQAALNSEEQASGIDVPDFDGWLYAFTFPTLEQESIDFPIKVGMTTVDVDARVTTQCRTAIAFEQPKILGRWQVKRVMFVEAAVHGILRARGKWREDAPGVEWFDTTPDEIASCVGFVIGREINVSSDHYGLATTTTSMKASTARV